MSANCCCNYLHVGSMSLSIKKLKYTRAEFERQPRLTTRIEILPSLDSVFFRIFHATAIHWKIRFCQKKNFRKCGKHAISALENLRVHHVHTYATRAIPMQTLLLINSLG